MKKIILFLSSLLIITNIGFTQTTFSLRSDGTILKAGQPFFPMGFYIDRNTVANYRYHVNSIAAGGFNVINLPYVSGNTGEWASFLDLCSSKGIYTLTQLDYAGSYTDPIYAHKNHPAVYGWSVADDADNGYFTIPQLQSRNSAIKSADANHITEMSLTGYYLSRRQAADSYTPIADVPGYQCYPITPPADYDVTASNALTQAYLRTLLYVQSAAKTNKALVMNAQAINWGNYSSVSNPRFPTVAEERNMIYSGLAAGVKGIISYVIDNLEAQTALWNECKALRSDVSTLEGALLNGTLTRVNTGDQELVASYWLYNNKCYVVVINTSYSASKNVSLTLPAGYSGTKTSLFSRMPNTLSLSGTTLSGSIAQQAVQVYTIDKIAGATTYYRIKSHQSNKYMWDNVNTLSFGTNPASDLKTQWSLENVGGYIAIKNRSTGHYINIETLQAYAEATAVPLSYWSAQWSLVDVGGGYKVIKNRFKSTESLNVGNNLSYVQHTANYPAGYWDGEWLFESVPATGIANNNNTALESQPANLSVYPNPAKEKLTITNIPANTNISVFTSDGKMIEIAKTTASVYDFNVTKWQAGIYLVKIQSDKGTTVKKVVIEK